MAAITISIGRNIGNAPMPLIDFRNFIDAVTNIINLPSNSATVFVNAAQSVGEWDGVREDSRTWVASVTDESVPYITAMLRGLARAYQQDAIAMSVGYTELITP